MKPKNSNLFLISAAIFMVASSVHAATVNKAATGTDITAPASWGGTAPGVNDTAAWIATSNAGAFTLGATGATSVDYDAISFTGNIGGANGAITIGSLTDTGTITFSSTATSLQNSSTNAVTVNDAIICTGTASVVTAPAVPATRALLLAVAGSGNLTVTNNVSSLGTAAANDGSVHIRGSGTGLGTVSGNINVDGPLTKTDTGTWVLSGTNTATYVIHQNGTLLVANNNALGSGTVYVSNTSTVTTMSLGSALTASSTSALANNFVITGAANTFNLGSGTGNLILTGNISQSGVVGTVTKSGTTTVTLNGVNSYSGGTVVGQGLVVANTSSALGTGNVILGNNAANAAQLNLGNGVNLTNALTLGANAGVSSQGAIQALNSSTATLSGPITITAATGAGGHFVTDGTSALNITGTITSASAPVIHRGGNLKLSGAGSYATFNVTGTVKVGAPNGIATNATVALGVSGNGTLDLNGLNQSLAGLTNGVQGSATVTNTFATPPTVSTLTLTNTGAVTYAGTIVDGTGGVSLVQAGAGTTALTGTNTYTGTTTVSAGTLSISGSLASGAAITGGTLNVTGTAAGSIAVASGGTLKGTGTTGDVTVGNGTGAITGGDGTTGILTVGNLTYNGTGVMNVGTLANYTSFPAINATGALTLNGGAGAVRVNLSTAPVASDTYKLLVFGSGSAVTGNFVLGTGPTLSARQSGVLTVVGTELDYVVTGDTPKWTGAQSSAWTTATVGGAGNWQLMAGGTPTDYINGDSVIFDDSAAGNTTIDISTANISPTAITFANSAFDYTIGSSGGFGITGAGSMTVNGFGSVTLNTANTYSGGTTILSGTVVPGTGTAFGTGSVSLNGGTVNLNGQSLANAISLGGGAVVGTGMLSGVISGSGALAYNSPGSTLTLTGTNTYTGGTTFTGNMLSFASGSLGTTGVVTMNGGTLQWFGANTQDLSSRLSIVSGQTTTFDIGSNNVSFGAAIGSATSASVVKAGSGTLTIASDNTYTGGTTVTTGTLNLAGSNNGNSRVGAGLLTVNSGATVSVGTDNPLGYGDAKTPFLSVNGGTVVSSGFFLQFKSLTMTDGTLTRSGNNWISYGDVAINASTTTGSTIAGGSFQMRFDANGTTSGTRVFNVARGTAAADLTVSSALANAGGGVSGVQKSGDGTMLLTATNTYTGVTTVNGGTLAVTGTIASASAATVGGATATGTPTLTGAGTVAGTVTIAAAGGGAAGIVNPGSIGGIGTLHTGATTISGAYVCDINGTTSDMIASSGALTLSGATLTFNALAAPTATSYTLATCTGTPAAFTTVNNLPAGYALKYSAGSIQLVKGGFDSWASGKSLDGTAGHENGATDDPNHNGISNLVEYVLNGEPLNAESPNGILPTLDVSGSNFVFTFTRRVESDADTTQVFEFGSNLSGWTDLRISAPTDTAVTIGTPNGGTPNLQTVVVSVPKGANTKMFGRLKVSKP